MQIRSYQQEDFEAVWQLHVLALQHAGAYKGSGPWDDDLYHIEERYQTNGGMFLVGVLDGKIVAMGAFRKTGEGRAEIKRMRVHPDVQGRGFGKMILLELERCARSMGYRMLHLHTSTVQVAAQHLYRGLKFRETGETSVSEHFTEIFFEKHL